MSTISPPRSNEPADAALAQLGAELLHRATESQAALERAWDALMANWGVRGEPVGIAQLREMIREDNGNQPIDNEFSRELIARREDHRP